MKLKHLGDFALLKSEMLSAPVHDRPKLSADSLEALPATVPAPPPGTGEIAAKDLVKTEDGARWVIFVLAGEADLGAAKLNNLGCAYGRIGDWQTAEAKFKLALAKAGPTQKDRIAQNLNVAKAAVAADV